MPYRLEPRPAFDARIVIHVSLTAALGWLGAILLLPGDTFATGEAWRLFRSYASEEQWALMMFAGAVVGAIGIDTAHRWLKIVSISLLSAAHWTLALLFLVGNPIGGASGILVILAAQGSYLALRQIRWGS
jgi:hypothetical protein